MNRKSKIAKASSGRFISPAIAAVNPVWIPIGFLVFAFLVGGSGRSDLASAPMLRGVSLLLAFWALTRMRGEDWRRIRVPLALLLALTVWIGLQLVPLPPEIWQNLPGRSAVVAIDKLLGQPDLLRPISLSPSQTLNSLLAMTVPIAALLLAAQINSDDCPRLMSALVAIACLSALLGLFQILSGPSSPAYLYRIVNSDSMVGLFANRNHHAIFLACNIPIVAMLLRDELMRKRKRGMVRTGLALIGVLLTALTIMIGSRTGAVAGVVASVPSYMMVAASWRVEAEAGSSRPRSNFARWLVYAPPVLLILVLGIGLWSSSRTTAITRFFNLSAGDDLRFSAWPTVQTMIETFWVAGSGFGSFPAVYKMYEPDSLLQPSYFNHAHNDWAEAVLTGGLPLILIVVATLFWFVRRFAALGFRNLVKGYRGDIRLPVLVLVFLLVTTSLADYPLRVPSIQVMAVMLILFLCCPKQQSRRRGD